MAATAESVLDPSLVEETVDLSRSQKFQSFFYGGALLALIQFSSPAGGMLDIPVTFFLKNRLHLTANGLAIFKLWIGAPLFVGFIFGFLRDRWSPFGRGDQAHLILFGLTCAAIYVAIAASSPAYWPLLLGMVAATMAFRMVSSAAFGITNTVGQKASISGQMSSLVSIAMSFPDLISFTAGGFLSQLLEGQAAPVAARILFLIAAALMVAIAALGLVGPKWLLEETQRAIRPSSFTADVKRLVRYWPLYPVMLIQLLWQFAPGTGTVLQYHIVDALHATDAQWGLWNAIFYGSFIPVYAFYGFIAQKVSLRPLLWIGFGVAVFQMAPLLLVHTASGALWAALPMGLIGGLAQAALVDLTIRSAPPGMQGTMAMLFWSMYFISVRFGDLFGTYLYDHAGGFTPTVVVTIIVYVLILPVLLLVPKRMTDGADRPSTDRFEAA